jgi:hypothetical protein
MLGVMASQVTHSPGIGRLAGVRSRQLSRAGMLLYVIAALLSAVGQAEMGDGTIGLAALFAGQAFQVLALFAFVASFVLWFRRARAPGSVAVEGDTLHVERAGLSLHVRLEDVESAVPVVHEPPALPTVELLLRGGDELSCEMPDAASAHSLAGALGFGPGQRRVRIPFATPRRRLLHPLLGLVTTWVAGMVAMVPLMLFMMRADSSQHFERVMGLRAGVTALITMLAVLGLYPLLKRIARAPELTIGDDGIVYTDGRKTRFVPRAKIWSVDQPHPRMATMIRSDGAPIIIMGTGIDAERRTAATWLLRERLQAPATVNATHFGRGGRSILEWRDHLRRAMDPSYRAAGTSPEDAEATLRNPGASDDEKVGAALALRVSGAEPARIRIAAEGTARDPLREAITAIADDASDDVVERKLARMQPPR